MRARQGCMDQADEQMVERCFFDNHRGVCSAFAQGLLDGLAQFFDCVRVITQQAGKTGLELMFHRLDGSQHDIAFPNAGNVRVGSEDLFH